MRYSGTDSPILSGTLYPTFNRPQFSERFTFQDFCQGAADELLIISGKSDDR